MKKHFLKFLLIFAITGNAQESDSAWVVNNYTKKEVMIPMRDGVKLFTAVYTPKAANEKHPILMVRTPYSVAPYGEKNFSPRLYTTHWKQYLRAGYILVLQDVRGTYMSEGEFVDVRPFNPKKKGKEFDEASDTYDAIEWLIKNVPGNNGNVGTFGISYPGFYSTMSAYCGHPALKAVSPQAPVTDWFMGDDFHHNGAFAMHDAFSFYSGFGKHRPVPTTKGRRGYQFPVKDVYDFHIKEGPVKNLTKLLADSIAFWKDLVQHPDYDDFWKTRDARRPATAVKPAVLVVGGTFDAEDCFGAWNLYKAIEKQSPSTNNRLIMGPWFHGGWGRSGGGNLGAVRFGQQTSAYFQKIEQQFFDYYLLGKGDDKQIKEATIFFTGEDQWRTFDQWPPATVSPKPVYLLPGGSLRFQLPAGANEKSTYVSDPQHPVPFSDIIPLHRNREYMIEDQRFADRRPDVLVFTTDPLEEDLTLGGPVKVNLKVTLSSTDADFVVKLIDAFPENFKYDTSYCCAPKGQERDMNGFQMLVRGEIMRGKYRNSFEKPEPFNPGKAETVAYTMPDVAHTFKKGHRLIIQVQSSWYPLFDMNPQTFTNIYTCDEKDFVKSEISILHSPEQPSFVELPVIPKK
jgi:putative CocE/NonD family hydrolase